ncbi:MAG: Hsp20/alpha crystallin family protein [Patescibacteria group bacterium]|nr:Hsp20/alpha crystallin family protein [Patescibacteria group bacterium]
MKEENKNDIFVELAKVKNKPMPIKVENDEDNDITEEEGQLTVDVYQDQDNIIVQSTVAGIKPDDIDISITNESVIIRGKREKEEAIEDKDYFYQECFWGAFSRSIILPQEIDPDKSQASMKNGVLTVKMPKLNRAKTKTLKVKTDL